MRKVARLLAAALVTLSAPLVHAEQLGKEGCGPRLEVQVFPLEVTEDHSLSFQKIHALTSQKSDHSATAAGHGVGVSTVRTTARIDYRVDQDGCPVMTVSAGYRDARMHVARELASNPCAFEHVRQHELHHIELYREALSTLASDVRDLLKPRLVEIFAMPPSAATNKAANLALDVASRVSQRHQEFDSDEEYAKNATECNGAIKFALRRSMR